MSKKSTGCLKSIAVLDLICAANLHTDAQKENHITSIQHNQNLEWKIKRKPLIKKEYMKKCQKNCFYEISMFFAGWSV